MPYTFAHSDIDNKLFTTNLASGGEMGKPFSFIAIEKGAILSRIKIWNEDWRLKGIQVWMSDDSTHFSGTKTASSKEFIFQDGELITRLNIQASGERSTGGKRRLGALDFETSKGRKWGVFSRWLQEDGRWFVDVGSGLCCGIFGAFGEDVDRLGFAMLRKVQSSRLVDVQYPNLSSISVSKTPTSSISKIYHNDTDAQQTYTIKDKRSVTLTREWSISTSLDLAIGVEVSASIPTVAEVSASTTWTVSTESSHSRSTAMSMEQEWEWPIVVPVGKTVEAEATIYMDPIDTEYTAKLELKLVNGAVYMYDRKGMYHGAQSRTGVIRHTQLDRVPPQSGEILVDVSQTAQRDWPGIGPITAAISAQARLPVPARCQWAQRPVSGPMAWQPLSVSWRPWK